MTDKAPKQAPASEARASSEAPADQPTAENELQASVYWTEQGLPEEVRQGPPTKPIRLRCSSKIRPTNLALARNLMTPTRR